jgi:DNA invertase Pin-like site-specific DNA recombinase
MLQQMAAVAELEAGLISERTKAALAAKVARDGQCDRKAKHHLVPGTGQRAASAALKERATQAAKDLQPIIAEIRASGAVSLRQIGQGLRERGIPSSRGGEWSASAVRNLLRRAAG